MTCFSDVLFLIERAQSFVFLTWLTPESVHYQHAEAILKQRHDVLMQAFLANPGRFSNKKPQLKKVPDSVYINPPQTIGITNISGQLEAAMAP